MLQFTPPIYESETIYSWLSRWALRSGMPTQKTALNHLIGKHLNSQLMSSFPSYIPELSLASGISASQLIYEHTALPYFRFSSDPELYNSAIQTLAYGKSQDLYSRLSITANRIPESSHLKFCPQCSLKDYKHLGTTFWHLEHQLPGVTSCSIHKTKLEHVLKGRSKLLLPPYTTKTSQLIPASDVSIQLTKLSGQLLDDSLPQASNDVLRNGYRRRLIELNYASSMVSIKQTALRAGLEIYWNDIRNEPCINAILKLGHTHTFPSCLFHGKSTQHHPLKHLLLIGFLFKSVKNCISYCYQTSDLFSSDLYQGEAKGNLALTPSKDSFQEMIIRNLQNGRSLRSTADLVGLNISIIKAIAVQNEIVISRRPKKLFASHRRQIWRQLMTGKSTKEIALSLKCSDEAVQKELRCYPEFVELRKRIRFYKKRSQHRENLANTNTGEPSLTRGLIQSTARTSYTWLYKYDREWLESNLPPAIPRHKRPPKAKR
jgi:hypothetical protein|tara:strand:- start:1325 stop:2791 length:1467 start_codon:yes stop_codon:yes gene_type:complete